MCMPHLMRLTLKKNKFQFKKYVTYLKGFLPSKEWKNVCDPSFCSSIFLLSIVQSKISWYFCNNCSAYDSCNLLYGYMKLTSKLARMLILCVVIVSFLWRFIPATYALYITSHNDPDNVKVAPLHSTLSQKNVSMLVNAQERQNRNVIEAAQQQTVTSFIYGGSPSFVYYTQKHVHYYYKVDEFIDDARKHQLVVVSVRYWYIYRCFKNYVIYETSYTMFIWGMESVW